MNVSTIAALMLAFPAGARPQEVRFPAPPPDGRSLTDDAGVVASPERSRIRAIGRQLQAEVRAPMQVVTIRSMADYGAVGWPIERFALRLFEAWDDGENVDWDRGILFLVSVDDRQAYVELGPEWLGSQRQRSRRVIEDLVLPDFRAGRLSEGIARGVVALDALARNRPLPTRAWSSAEILGLTVAAGLVLAALVALQRNGGGWASSLGRLVVLGPFERAEPSSAPATGAAGGEPRLSVHGGASGRW